MSLEPICNIILSGFFIHQYGHDRIDQLLCTSTSRTFKNNKVLFFTCSKTYFIYSCQMTIANYTLAYAGLFNGICCVMDLVFEFPNLTDLSIILVRTNAFFDKGVSV